MLHSWVVWVGFPHVGLGVKGAGEAGSPLMITPDDVFVFYCARGGMGAGVQQSIICR